MVEITFIELLGVKIQDPMTLFTDLLLGFQCLALAWFLYRQPVKAESNLWFLLYFLLMGIGSIEGGFVNHGFFYLLGPGWKSPMVLIIGLSLSCLQYANLLTVKETLNPRSYSLLRACIPVQFFFFLLYLTQFPLTEIDFKMLVPHLAIGLFLFVVILQVYGHFTAPRAGRRTLLLSILLILPVGIVTIAKYSPDKWFNQFDLVHVLLLLPMYLIYKAAALFNLGESTKKGSPKPEEPVNLEASAS
ncbi:MAG: hypothetical protein NWR72_02090 [Bacteroidia bacterium]|nr:hypothetical protein [Bacteroidia bacterium]